MPQDDSFAPDDLAGTAELAGALARLDMAVPAAGAGGNAVRREFDLRMAIAECRLRNDVRAG